MPKKKKVMTVVQMKKINLNFLFQQEEEVGRKKSQLQLLLKEEG
jgi:hypothetical protein